MRAFLIDAVSQGYESFIVFGNAGPSTRHQNRALARMTSAQE